LTKALAGAYRSKATQNAIRELDIDSVHQLFPDIPMAMEPSLPSDSGGNIPGGHKPVMGRMRVGQQRFREEMLARFGSACAIIGAQPAAALEAAHLYRYAAQPEHDLRGGLLFRRDLHALFDRCLLSIDPDRWTVWIDPELTEYADLFALNGRPLEIAATLRPRTEYLAAHYAISTQSRARQMYRSPFKVSDGS
jgi:hypothetical protein